MGYDGCVEWLDCERIGIESDEGRCERGKVDGKWEGARLAMPAIILSKKVSTANHCKKQFQVLTEEQCPVGDDECTQKARWPTLVKQR